MISEYRAPLGRQFDGTFVMWIFTRYGFYSAVCARQGSGDYGNPPDPARIMVRARCREHLQALLSRFPAELGDCPIEESNSTDYRYRFFVAKGVWSGVMKQLVDELDYDNFKAAVAAHLGPAGRPYEHALHEVWATMHDLQE